MGTEPLLIVLAEDDDGHASLVQRNLERAGFADSTRHGAGPFIRTQLNPAVPFDDWIALPENDSADGPIACIADDSRGLRERGVVGDILGQFFDAGGNVVDLPIHDRRIGIELADLRRIPKVVGVAGGEHKAEAILGALRGGFLDVLVTNELAAIRLLELERSRPR